MSPLPFRLRRPTLAAACLLFASLSASYADSPLGPVLRNPGFEEVSSGGEPVSWVKFREAFFDNDSALARSGRGSVRSSLTFGWAQELLPPCSPYQTFAVTGYATREFPFEEARTRVGYWSFSDEYLRDTNDSSPFPGDTGYQPFWTLHEVPPSAGRLYLYLAGRQNPSWLRYDDLRLYTEQLQTSGSQIGESWSLDQAHEENGTLTLFASGSASQRVAAGRDNQAYFLAGSYAAAAGTTLTVAETWLPRSDRETTASSSATVSLAPGRGFFLADIPRPVASASGQSLVTLRADSPGAVSLSGLRRGFAKVEPATFTAGISSPDTPLRLTAAWPDPLATATVTILTSEGDPVDTPEVVLHGSSLRADWTGADAPAGSYVARFRLNGGDNTTVEVNRPFSVRRADDMPSSVPPLPQDSFIRCAWLYVSYAETSGYIDDVLRLAREDGFNYATVACRPDQFATVRAAAEREGLSFFIQSVPASTLFQEYANRDFFDSADYTARLRELYAPLLGSPRFRGVYVVDEPTSPQALELAQRAGLAVARDPALGFPFLVFTDRTPVGSVAAVAPAVHMVDQYPFRSTYEASNPGALLEVIPRMHDYVRSAAALGRRFWLVPQAFWAYEFENFRPVPASMHRAQLGAAILAGAKGVVPFTYTSISYIEGIRGPDLEPTRHHAPYREFNTLMDRLGPLVMALETPMMDFRAPVPFAVSTAVSADDGQNHLIVLNADDTATRTLSVGLTPQPSASLTDLVDERPLPLQPDGSLAVELAPGGWALIPIGSAAVADLTQSGAAPAPPLSTLDLPLLYQFTVRNGDGTPSALTGLSFSPDAAALAVSTMFPYIPGTSHVYLLRPGGVAEEEPSSSSFWGERRLFLDDGSVVEASPWMGFRRYTAGALTGPPAAEFTGRSGGAYNVVASPSGDLWMTLDHWGIRHAAESSTGIRSLAAGESFSDTYRDLFGPLPDGSVVAVIRNTGADRIRPGLLTEELHERAPVRHSSENSSLNSRGLLAIPRGARGVALLQVGEGGGLQSVGIIADDVIEAVAAAWITDDVLAVADGIRNVRLYRLRADRSATLLGSWRPPVAGPMYIGTLASREGLLVLGLQDGRVFLTDTRPATRTAAQADWQLYE